MFCVLALVVLSCSNDDNTSAPSGDSKLVGRVMSPNGQFPISEATIKVFQDDQLVREELADAIGNFAISGLPDGNLTVELSKGKFRKQFEILMSGEYTLQPSERNLDVFPEIAVVTGTYDAIEEVLLDVGIVDSTGSPAFDIVEGGFSGRYAQNSHNHAHQSAPMQRTASLFPNVDFTFEEMLMDSALLNSYDILFLNCGADEWLASDPTATANLKSFIENGGVVYATDWMYAYLQSVFATENYMTFSTPEMAGDSDVAMVEVTDVTLTQWLEDQGISVTPSVMINGFLPGWQLVDSFNPSIVNDWLVADNVMYNGVIQQNKALAFTYKFQQGGVFYSSFHTHGNLASEDVITQMMNYFIFELSALQD